MNTLRQSGFAIALACLVASGCKTNSNVVSHSVIQKRKYNKGFHVDAMGTRSRTRYQETAIPASVPQQPVQNILNDTLTVKKASRLEQIAIGEDVKSLTQIIELRRELRREVSQNMRQRGDESMHPDENEEPEEKEPFRMTHGLSTASFILAVLGIIHPWWVLGFLAMFFGLIAILRILKYPERFKGLGIAIAAIALGVVGLLLSLLAISMFI